MIKEYYEKNDYSIVDVYNDAGHSGKDLMRPEMQRLLADIKSKKIDKLIAIKVDRLTRNIATIMKDNNAYLKQGKRKADRIYIIKMCEYKL